MRTLKKNQNPFYYSTYSENGNPIYDSNGRFTGDYESGYSKPIRVKGNISDGTTKAVADRFGLNIQCDKSILLNGLNTNIQENSVLFIGIPVDENTTAINTDGSKNYNFIISGIARSDKSNFTILAVKRVK